MQKAFIILIALCYSVSLNAQDQNIDNRLRLAQSFEQIGQINKAEAIYRELYNSQPSNYQFFELLNKSLVSQKKYDESVKLIESKINLTPGDYNLYGMLGSTYYIMDQTQKAFVVWEKGIAVNSSSNISYRVMANYAIENRAYEKAIDILQRGKKISGDPIMFSMDLANIYAANMKFENAADEFCNLIEFHPEQVQTVKARMNSYLNRPGAVEETIRAIKKFIKSKTRVEFYDLLVFVYQASGNYQNAYETVIEMEKKFNGIGTNLFVFAQEAFRNREYNWASEAYNFIVNNYPNSSYLQLAKMGYARTLEAALDQKFLAQNESWKPLTRFQPLYTNEYKKIVTVYEVFINGFQGNSINLEALFRIAEIYRNRIFDYQKADSLYNELTQISPNTNYGIQANIARGKIAIEKDDLINAQKFFRNVLTLQRIEPNELAEANFYLAKIDFWKGNFANSIKLFKDVTKNLSTDFSNDAIELSSIISIAKKDSVNLLLFAQADLHTIQYKHKQASIEFKTLSDNPNIFIINDFAKIKFSEILILENDISSAVKILEEISKSLKSTIFVEKAIFLLAECYQYGIKDLQKAAQTYKKLLETFPNSLYFDRAREALNGL